MLFCKQHQAIYYQKIWNIGIRNSDFNRQISNTVSNSCFKYLLPLANINICAAKAELHSFNWSNLLN